MISVNVKKGDDVYIEVNGKKLANVQSYKVTESNKQIYIESFLEFEPVEVIPGKREYKIEVSKVCLNEESLNDKIDFHSISNFDLVINKSKTKVKYSGCEWTQISESGDLGKSAIEKAEILAVRRLEL